MTREEAVARLKDHKIIHKMDEPRAIYISEAIDMAITALEQEPCPDAISRQAALAETYNWSKDEFLRVTNPFDYLRKRINSLPSVNPQLKTGYWIKYGIPRCGEQHYKCTSCGYYINFGQWGELYTKEFKYCPNCGAKMVESQERK